MWRSSFCAKMAQTIAGATLLIFTALLLSASAKAASSDPVPLLGHLSLNESTVFVKGEAGYYCIKIPVVLTTFNDTILAFGEARRESCSDYASTDIVLKRSVDHGQSWSDLQVVYSNTSMPDFKVVIGNAAPVQDRTSGRILLPFCRNNMQVLLTYSDDDGTTWAPPFNISGVTYPNWTWVGTGPPGSIQLTSGRIVVPSYHSYTPNDNGDLSEDHVMYSDDHGETWQLGGNISDWQAWPNECQAVEVSPNVVFINTRAFWEKRMGAYSHDGGLTFGQPFNIDIPNPLSGCEGSTIRHPSSGLLFYSGPADTSVYRFNMSLWASADSGKSFQLVATLDTRSSAYSSLTVLKDGSLAVLYEWSKDLQIVFEPDAFSFAIILSPPQIERLRLAYQAEHTSASV